MRERITDHPDGAGSVAPNPFVTAPAASPSARPAAPPREPAPPTVERPAAEPEPVTPPHGVPAAAETGPRWAHIGVRYRFGDPGATRILVNGTDVAAHARSVGLELESGVMPARLTLDLASDVDLDMTGVVQLLPTADGPAQAHEAVVAFLDGVDVTALEQHVLAGGMGGGMGGGSPVAAVVDALRAAALRG